LQKRGLSVKKCKFCKNCEAVNANAKGVVDRCDHCMEELYWLAKDAEAEFGGKA
jgi:hypothetical protein